jgi:hypothetical protein
MKLQFDANKVAPLQGLGPVPADTYTAAVVSCVQRENKDTEGWHLATVLEITEGAYANRKLFHNINIGNASADSREIANGQLSAICHATGVLGGEELDTDDFRGIPMKVDVGLTVQEGFGKSNRVNGYSALSAEASEAGDGGIF